MIMVHQPVSPYLSADGWVDYHVAIAEAVPGPGRGAVHPGSAGSAAQHIRRLGERCPNVVGVKYGVRDLVQFAAVARDAGLDRFTWLAGLAELTAPGCWAYGAAGFTSGLANVAPGLSLALLAVAARRRHGRRPEGLWQDCRAFEELRAADALGRQRQRGQGGAGPARAVPAGTSARPAGCCRTPSGSRSPRSWLAGAWHAEGAA